jgi:hypothetical protein
MENMIEIAPNQLPLFADMLTVEQEQRIAEAKSSAKKQMDRERLEVIRKAALVDATGFINDSVTQEYSYLTECKKVMRSINVNKWNEVPQMVEVELDQFNGYFFILFDEYDKNKNEIIKRKALITLWDDFIECYALNQNSRAMKPTTILTKIAAAAETAKYKYELANKTKSNIEYTVDKYKKLYPNAEVEAGKGYNSGRGNWEEYDTITVKFKSGSYVIFKVYTTPDQEYTAKRYDAVTSKMTNTELMDHFNAQ